VNRYATLGSIQEEPEASHNRNRTSEKALLRGGGEGNVLLIQRKGKWL